MKKPFASSQDRVASQSQHEEDSNTSETTITKKSRRKLKVEQKEKAKPKSRCKKETIAVDYPETSLKKLEKTKEEKVAKQKS